MPSERYAVETAKFFTDEIISGSRVKQDFSKAFADFPRKAEV